MRTRGAIFVVAPQAGSVSCVAELISVGNFRIFVSSIMEYAFEFTRQTIHYTLHLLVPFAFARRFWKDHWRTAALIMLATMLIDLDHLLATPVYDSQRCSIGFHPLHTVWAAAGYLALFAAAKWWRPSWRRQAVAVGCGWHLITDLLDCYLGNI